MQGEAQNNYRSHPAGQSRIHATRTLGAKLCSIHSELSNNLGYVRHRRIKFLWLAHQGAPLVALIRVSTRRLFRNLWELEIWIESERSSEVSKSLMYLSPQDT